MTQTAHHLPGGLLPRRVASVRQTTSVNLSPCSESRLVRRRSAADPPHLARPTSNSTASPSASNRGHETNPDRDSGMSDLPRPSYDGAHRQASWSGHVLAPEILNDMRRSVRERLYDLSGTFDLRLELNAAATTQMEIDNISDILRSVPEPQHWEVGEAIAEVVLERWHAARWPWNAVRDRKIPQASLPGADLVGFVRTGDTVQLLFGEVKSSSDSSRPPNVVYGRHGMIYQLERLAVEKSIQFTLLKWLRSRCTGTEYEEDFRTACRNFIRNGRLTLVGCLMRDLGPDENDLSGRGRSLGDSLNADASARLTAWYLPSTMDSWPSWIGGVDDD